MLDVGNFWLNTDRNLKYKRAFLISLGRVLFLKSCKECGKSKGANFRHAGVGFMGSPARVVMVVTSTIWLALVPQKSGLL